LSSEISRSQQLRVRQLASVVFAAMSVWIATGVAATAPAAGKAHPRPLASAYKLSLRFSARLLLGNGSENPIAVDRHGTIYMFEATRTQQGSIPSADAANVVELSPSGKKIRSFSTTFRSHGQRVYIDVDGLAVTPNGHEVLVVGNYSSSLHGLVDSKPFLAKYSARTGAFIHGYNFDSDEDRLGVGVAVDPTGQHVYVGDERNQFIGATAARVYEFDVNGLRPVRHFRLAGNDVCCDLAVAPDGHLFAQIGPPGSTQVLLQRYGSNGVFESQFASPPGGLAIGPTGDLFVGSRAKRRIDRLSSTAKLRLTLGAGHFNGLPVAGAVGRGGGVYTLDAGRNDVATLLEFTPVLPQTTIKTHPSSTLQIPTATFKFNSSVQGAKLECRLLTAGAGTPAFTPCSSPKAYNHLADGSYTFQARSVSPAGPVDPTPAHFHFKVSLPRPQTVITSTPASTIGLSSATFRFTSPSSGATFACRLDPVGSPHSSFKPCPSPVTYVQLVNGTWEFEVQAISADGVADPTPATYKFTVDTTPPTVSAPASPTIPAGGQLQPDGTFGVQEAWSATDGFSASSDLLYTLEQRTGPSPATLGSFTDIQGLTTAPGTTAAVIPIAPGGAYHQFRVRAENQLGVSAEGPAGDAFHLHVIDSADPSITYSTGWSATTDNNAFDHTLEKAGTGGSTATLMFSGKSIAIIAPVGPTLGSMQVCLDPPAATTNAPPCPSLTLHAATASERDAVYVLNGLTPGMHTIQLTDLSGSSVALDGFVVLG
jgi:hypothetical protein